MSVHPGYRYARVMPCACGGAAEADPLDPYPGVRRHVISEPHRGWSDRTSLVCREPLEGPTAAPVTLVDVSGHRTVRPAFRRLAVAR